MESLTDRQKQFAYDCVCELDVNIASTSARYTHDEAVELLREKSIQQYMRSLAIQHKEKVIAKLQELTRTLRGDGIKVKPRLEDRIMAAELISAFYRSDFNWEYLVDKI